MARSRGLGTSVSRRTPCMSRWSSRGVRRRYCTRESPQRKLGAFLGIEVPRS
jgi:hypothetical protein